MISEQQNAFLIRKTISPQAPELTPDGAGIFKKVSGEYIYALTNVFDEMQTPIFMGHLPSNILPTGEQLIQPSDFQRQIIDTGGGEGQGGGGFN